MTKEKDSLRRPVGFSPRQKEVALANGGYSVFAGLCMDYYINNVLPKKKEDGGDNVSGDSETSSQS